MNASFELFHELGPAEIERYVAGLTDQIVAWAADHKISARDAERSAEAGGHRVAASAELQGGERPASRGSRVAFVPRGRDSVVAALVQHV